MAIMKHCSGEFCLLSIRSPWALSKVMCIFFKIELSRSYVCISVYLRTKEGSLSNYGSVLVARDWSYNIEQANRVDGRCLGATWWFGAEWVL